MRWLLLSLLTCGCAATPRHGSFIEGRMGQQQALSQDAAELLAAGKPEGATFALPEGTADPFGRGLADALRSRGHFVTAGEKDGALSVRYVVDELRGTDLLRVVLWIGHGVRSRAYRAEGTSLVAAGPWTVAGAGQETP